MKKGVLQQKIKRIKLKNEILRTTESDKRLIKLPSEPKRQTVPKLEKPKQPNKI